VAELFLVDGKNLRQLTNFGRQDTGLTGSFISRGRVLFSASANPTGENPAEMCQVFSIDRLGLRPPRQLTHLPTDRRPSFGCRGVADVPPDPRLPFGPCGSGINSVDPITGTVLLTSNCDPVGGNPFGEQLFAMRPDGTGLRQLTSARGMTTDPDGTVHVELPGPFAYYSAPGGS
jgi:hypothetical protein